MSTVSTTGLYDEDLHGTNPANLITNELQTLQIPGPNDFYFIIPKAAPFFVDSLEVYNAQTGVKYVEGSDYIVGHRFVEAMESIGRPIAGSIRFMKRTITGQVRLKYRTIGGQWGFSDAAILAELSRKQYNPLIRSWGDIDVLPASFPALQHDQSVDSLVGSEEINASLNRIADILEATASGTTESHLKDFNNPHQVTKQQVQLGNVPNYLMASDQQHIDAARNDLFTNPRGVKLSIQEFALKPLNAHIAATGNVHGLTTKDIGLEKVPNYPAATAQQATDPTNNATLMTPYTTSLLIQAQQADPRLDQLIADFNAHLAATNPHNIDPHMIGTLSEAEIRALVQQGGAGGDATTFGGETPTDWEAKFPAVADINIILDELATTVQAGVTALTVVDVTDPVTPGDETEHKMQLATWGEAGYGAYAIYNALGNVQYVASTDAAGYPTTVQSLGPLQWGSTLDANYMLDAQGALRSWGTAKVAIPTAYASGSGFVAANKMNQIWVTKGAVYAVLASAASGAIVFQGGNPSPVLAGLVITDMWLGQSIVDTRRIGIAESDDGTDTPVYTAFGDSSFVTAMTAQLNTFKSLGKIEDIRILDNYIVIIGTKTGSAVGKTMVVLQINYGANITLTDVTTTFDVYNHQTGLSVKANTLNQLDAISGNYGHAVITRQIVGTEIMELYSFGSSSNGQRYIPGTAGPFLAAMAGFDYTVTVDATNYVQFWGDSPDNSLLWPNGRYIIPGG
ncbi:tail protein [Pseudomonas phage PhiPA3]|uniref:Virion structural protein n=1 Tax=Pseudomonas phage PhiPA3 TaxID=998086 RepID=F8SK23_BPPA3|nr:tail protein [Pseudomonas phage PhiPA3]AEH03573.1 virion structural protein [Pseudomonas phage PhiPA3]